MCGWGNDRTGSRHTYLVTCGAWTAMQNQPWSKGIVVIGFRSFPLLFVRLHYNLSLPRFSRQYISCTWFIFGIPSVLARTWELFITCYAMVASYCYIYIIYIIWIWIFVRYRSETPILDTVTVPRPPLYLICIWCPYLDYDYIPWLLFVFWRYWHICQVMGFDRWMYLVPRWNISQITTVSMVSVNERRRCIL